MISVEIRDENDMLLGKVWRSTSFVHCHADYETEIEQEGNTVRKMTLKRRSDRETIFELEIRTPTDIEINGIFHIRGFSHPIIATRDYLKIGGLTLTHNTKVRGGRGIALTESGFSI